MLSPARAGLAPAALTGQRRGPGALAVTRPLHGVTKLSLERLLSPGEAQWGPNTALMQNFLF